MCEWLFNVDNMFSERSSLSAGQRVATSERVETMQKKYMKKSGNVTNNMNMSP